MRDWIKEQTQPDRSQSYYYFTHGNDYNMNLQDTATTVFAHNNGAGMGMKADDFDGCDCCMNCHSVLDRRVKTYLSQEVIDAAFTRGRLETIKNRLERKIFK